jgi:hypothetical protein
MKIKISLLIVIVLLFTACSLAQVREYADKGVKVYTLASDNQDIIDKWCKQIEKTDKALQAYRKDVNPFTEMNWANEMMKLYYVSLETRIVLKELGKILKEE